MSMPSVECRRTVVYSSIHPGPPGGPVPWLEVLPGKQFELQGGRVRAEPWASLIHCATAMLSGLVIDPAIPGGNGISRELGLTTPTPGRIPRQTQGRRLSRGRLFVGVHTKFGANSFCRFADITDFDMLITDTGLTA